VRVSKEGDQNMITFYVSPNETGAWIVHWLGETRFVDRRHGKPGKHATTEGSAFSVQRSSPMGKASVNIPDSVNPPAQDYRLKFMDETGNVNQEL